MQKSLSIISFVPVECTLISFSLLPTINTLMDQLLVYLCRIFQVPVYRRLPVYYFVFADVYSIT